MDKFKGIFAPIVSPCGEADQLDAVRFEANLHRLLGSGIDGLYVCGGTGDGGRMTAMERRLLADLAVREAKRAGKATIVHVGQTHLREARQLADHARAAGADAVASIPPAAGWDEVLAFYRTLAEAGLPVFVYYIPQVTGQRADLGQLLRLLDLEGVAGIKMSDWNLFLMREVKLERPDRIVYSGFDEVLVHGLLSGADGAIGTWANLLPETFVAIRRLVADGRVPEALALQDVFSSFLHACWRYGVIDAFEEIMRAKGFADRCFRRPTSWNPGKIGPAPLAELVARLDALRARSQEALR